jgi:ABC-type dipeptide/oligopeptide/nickel transport system ATPase component
VKLLTCFAVSSANTAPSSDASFRLMLLDVQDLTVTFAGAGPPLTAVDRVTFQIAPGETLGLVGESGSGKSVTAFSILRLLQPPGRITGGRVIFEGRDLVTLSEREMREVRGAKISLIFQEPMTALNPVMRVGDQIAEALTVHGLAIRSPKRSPSTGWPAAATRGFAPSSCSRRSRLPNRRAASATIRISCPAACASA